MSDEVISQDTTALIQKGVLQQPGFYGSQEMSDSNDAFNAAVGIAVTAAAFAGSLKKKQPAPPSYVRTKDNYILTELERLAIQNKAQQLAAYGVVPYDTLENFFYILAATENPSDLNFIAGVVNIPEMGQPRYIRNIRGICDLPDIYKIGYLAQGVASVNQRYAPRFRQVETYTDQSRSYYGGINNSVNISSQLGVLGPIVLSAATNLAGGGKYLSAAPSIGSSSITNAVNAIGGIYGGRSFSPIGNALPPAAINAILNPKAAAAGAAAGLASGIVGQLGAGIGGALKGLLGASPLGGALSALGPLGGIAAGILLGQSGGYALGSFLSEVLLGTRIKSAQLANNPMLQPPSYAGKAFFGEAPTALPAIDQVFCRSIGAFGSPTGGNGVVSFGMQNFASLGGGLSVGSLVSRMVTGSFDIPSPTTFYGSQINQNITNVASILNVATNAIIEPRRSDNAIPFMIGFGSAILGETFNPFGSRPFTDSWKLAASTANDIQRYNPQYLATCRTSL